MKVSYPPGYEFGNQGSSIRANERSMSPPCSDAFFRYIKTMKGWCFEMLESIIKNYDAYFNAQTVEADSSSPNEYLVPPLMTFISLAPVLFTFNVGVVLLLPF